MTTITRSSLNTAARSMIVLVLVTSFWWANSRAGIGDIRGLDRLQAAVDSAARVRMEHVSIIVATARQLLRAEESLALDDISTLTAAAEQEQVRYGLLVREEFALRQQLALARGDLQH
jgi:hypothetical protein